MPLRPGPPRVGRTPPQAVWAAFCGRMAEKYPISEGVAMELGQVQAELDDATAMITAVECSVDIDKLCDRCDPDTGISPIAITVTNTSDPGVDLVDCVVSDDIYLDDETCPAIGTPTPLGLEGCPSPLASGADCMVQFTSGPPPLECPAANDADVSCGVDLSGNGQADDINGNGVPDECDAAGDIDGDGSVGITDFLMMLGAWGACPPPCPPWCPADLDSDCSVGINDFLLLLSLWD